MIDITVFKGKDAKIVYNGTTLGNVDSASVDIARGVETYYEVGSGAPAEIVEGNVEITGSLSRAWLDTTLAELIGTDTTTALSAFTLVLKASTTADGTTPQITVGGCKVESGTIDITQDGYVMGDVDFVGKTYTLTTVS